jgi:hypothetical protein
MRILFGSWLLLCSLASAHAENNIHLSCSHGHAVKKTTFQDGHVSTGQEDFASTFQIDVDLEHKTINGAYDAPDGQRLEDASVSIGGYASKFASEHEAGYQDTISIDRLSGRVVITHLYLPSGDCGGRADGTPACRMSITTTVYHCLPAVTDFPTPIPRMMRLWERLHRSFHFARVKRVLSRWYTSMERHISHSLNDE